MTEFPNFGLLNQMSKHIANNASPRILDYQINDTNGYSYSPTSTDYITQSIPTNNSITQQQRFNAIADQLMYNNSTRDYNLEQRMRNQGGVISSLIEPQLQRQAPQQNSNTYLNTTAEQGKINDNSGNSEKFESSNANQSNSSINPAIQVRLNIISIIIIGFILFMLFQLYISQKKLELMVDLYNKPRYDNRIKNEIF